MTNRVIGPGIGLPIPQILYPPFLTGDPYAAGTSDIALAAGQSVQIPAGDYLVDLGKYSILEYQDPVRSGPNITQNVGVWRPIRTQRGTFTLRSDGINFRISNLTGCAVSATVTNGGNSYVQASTTVTPSTGTSTWQPIIGGAITAISCSAVGSNYGKAPVVFIPSPPVPGVQAAAIATISAGKINGFTMVNQGAGYTSVPTITILADPYDAAAGIVSAVAFAAVGSPDNLTAVLCTNPGAPVATSMTLTVAGAGTSALVTPTFLTTISALSVTALGSGSFTQAALMTIGGLPPAVDAYTSQDGFLPRQLSAMLSISSGHATGINTMDTGLFLGSVFPIIALYGGSYADATAGNAITVQLTQGSATDKIIVQPL